MNRRTFIKSALAASAMVPAAIAALRSRPQARPVRRLVYRFESALGREVPRVAGQTVFWDTATGRYSIGPRRNDAATFVGVVIDSSGSILLAHDRVIRIEASSWQT